MMPRLPEYDGWDASRMAELVRSGEVSPAELTEAAIERIEARNPALNAVILPLFERARDRVRQGLPDGPFRGVPFLLKDLLIDLAGVPTSNGSRFFAGCVPEQSSPIVERYERAGLVILGKTNVPECGQAVTTEPELHGPTHNPWDLTRSPGGSSGGSAAAVAARMVPAASGSDGGGSIRIPASCCGLVGLKPSRGRTYDEPEPARQLAVEHVICRSVRDSAAFLDLLAVDHDDLPRPERPFVTELGAPSRRLRLAYSDEPLLPGEVEPVISNALEEAARVCRELGHELVRARPPMDGTGFAWAYADLVCRQLYEAIEKGAARFGRPVRAGDFEATTWLIAELGRTLSEDVLGAARTQIRATEHAIRVFMDDEHIDLCLSPTLPELPWPLGSLAGQPLAHAFALAVGRLGLAGLVQETAMERRQVVATLAHFPFTPVANGTGQPSLSLPLSVSPEGLPIGMMFTARLGDEATLLRLAAELEQACPWADRMPPLGGGLTGDSSALPR